MPCANKCLWLSCEYSSVVKMLLQLALEQMWAPLTAIVHRSVTLSAVSEPAAIFLLVLFMSLLQVILHSVITGGGDPAYAQGDTLVHEVGP